MKNAYIFVVLTSYFTSKYYSDVTLSDAIVSDQCFVSNLFQQIVKKILNEFIGRIVCERFCYFNKICTVFHHRISVNYKTKVG